ncbi:MAG: lipoprotein insertase outer membrane protein LolB [Pseudohongiella nitratireducens]|nr:lipoprotein insertase outer membrane protein LolB [Pseudohongiella nitratireducens]MDF1624278.1 lipoprotein insertase outer membrane protein LolB [Pseudohongiella nitratireducens]
MSGLRLLSTLLALTLLAGCAGTDRMDAPANAAWEQRQQVLNQLQEWSIQGSLHVRDNQDSQSARIRWWQQQEEFQVNLWGTFNIGATEISGTAERVTVIQAGEPPFISEEPEMLFYDQLGFELPIHYLHYWIKGAPFPGMAAELTFGELNQVSSLNQNGWQVQYLAYTNYGLASLPTRIRLSKSPLRLDLVRLNWTLTETGDDSDE